MPRQSASSSSRRRVAFARAAAVVFACALGTLLVARTAHAAPLDVAVESETGDRTVLRFRVSSYALDPVTIDGQPYVRVRLPGEAVTTEAGAPDLPAPYRSLIVSDATAVSVHVLSSSYHDVPNVSVAPSKGILYRPIDPASVPYSFGPSYAAGGFYPTALATAGSPYVLRDHRGVAVGVRPFQYDAATRTLRVYDELRVELVESGTNGPNPLTVRPAGRSAAFGQIARHHFLNFDTRARYAPLEESGELIIIAHDAWLPNVAPLAAHKISVGIPTTVVGVSTIGNTAADISAYLASAYASGNPAFVLLVGDAAQVATPFASGGSSDPSYAKLAGNDDYPDVLVGRFSAESAADVDTQVARTIAYEQGEATRQPWFWKATGIGSAEGPGDDDELDYEHIDHIRTDLLAYGYTTVDTLYDPGATAASLTSALEEGRGLVNYCGHGSIDGWGTTGFSSSDVGALQNVGKLPFIISVACNNGEFSPGGCFAESWMRATWQGEAVGAIGIYASSILQSWNPPMAAQDEVADLLTTEAYVTFGGLAFAGSARMMDEYQAAGVEMFDTWILFGDPSLRVVGTAMPPTGLGVAPFAGLAISGDAGGPFEPADSEYTLENYDDTPIAFSVTASEPWLAVSPPSGTIPAHGTITVGVALGPQADGLSNGSYVGTLTFTNLGDHEGDTTRTAGLTVGVPRSQIEFPLDEDPGWTTEGGWAFGVPTGEGGSELGAPDPSGGHTGRNVYGYNLHGDYPGDLSPQHLTTGALDCSDLEQVSLKFWRWLGVEDPQWDSASIGVSTDGQKFVTVWQNSGAVGDAQWTQQEVDLSSLADGQHTVYVRFTLGPTDSAVNGCGWNLDDLSLWGVRSCHDADGDGYLGAGCGGEDCDEGDESVHPGAVELCQNGVDDDCNGAVDGEDAACQLPVDPAAGVVGAGGCSCRTVGPGPALPGLMGFGVLLGLCTLKVRREKGAQGGRRQAGTGGGWLAQ